MYHFYVIFQLLSYGCCFTALVLAAVVYRRTHDKLVLKQGYALFGASFFLLSQLVNVYMIVAGLLELTQPYNSFFVVGLLMSSVILCYAMPRLAFYFSGLRFPKPFRLFVCITSFFLLIYIFVWTLSGPGFREGFINDVVLLFADFLVFFFLCYLVFHLNRHRRRITEPDLQRLSKGYVRLFLVFLPFYAFEIYLCATEFIKVPYHFFFTPFMLFFWNLINLRSLLKRFMGLIQLDAQPTAAVPVSFKEFGLTKREEEVAALLLSKYSYQEIADRLGISLSTVKTHTQNIYQKMSITRRHEMPNRMGRM